MDIKDIPDDEVPGTQISLAQAIIWSIREQRLHGSRDTNLEFHIKLDGRPLFGNFNEHCKYNHMYMYMTI